MRGDGKGDESFKRQRQQSNDVRLAIVTTPQVELLSDVEEAKVITAAEYGAYPRLLAPDGLEIAVDWAFRARWHEQVFGLLMDQLVVPIGVVDGQFAFLPAPPRLPPNLAEVQGPRDVQQRLIRVARHGAKMVRVRDFDSFMCDVIDWVDQATESKIKLDLVLAGELVVRTDSTITFHPLGNLSRAVRNAFERQFQRASRSHSEEAEWN